MSTTSRKTRISSSFRDPSGFLAQEDGKLLRHIDPSYRKHYDMLVSSGLYSKLVDDCLLIPHREIKPNVLEPEIIPFISYPYEWCFSAYKDAALATLFVQETALDYGMVLKDASAYNVQFRKGQPVLIDTLSFEKYQASQPWGAYRQFCQHFLAPLALMSRKDARLGQMMKLFIDGIPLELAGSLLPKLDLNFGLAIHIRGQATAQSKVSKLRKLAMSESAMRGLVKSLRDTINWLGIRNQAGWSTYTRETSYNQYATASKQSIIASLLKKVEPRTVWDLGANDGSYSVLATSENVSVVTFDSDPDCVESCYINHRDKLLPLVIDLSNPTPGIGWANNERMSLQERGPVDLVMALALVHHLAIGNNTPLSMIADWFRNLGKWLIVEFVPKEDPQVQVMLSGRADIFTEYTRDNFEKEFGLRYELIEKRSLPQSCRSIYLFRTK